MLWQKRNLDSVLMLTRDILENIFYIETDIVCSRCDTQGMLMVKDGQIIFYECRTCGYTQDISGDSYKAKNFEIPTLFDISSHKDIGVFFNKNKH